MKAALVSLSALAVIAITSLVIAQEKTDPASPAAEHKVFDPASIVWGAGPPALPPGVKSAVLFGDPHKSGVFTIRLRMPAGYKVPPHTHPTAELLTIISGTLNLGTGDKFDESAGHALAPGTFASMPAGMKHFAWAKEETVVQVHAEGPFQINYVNPA